MIHRDLSPQISEYKFRISPMSNHDGIYSKHLIYDSVFVYAPFMTLLKNLKVIAMACLIECVTCYMLSAQEPDVHWSFQSLEQPDSAPNHLATIDSFVQAKLSLEGLQIQHEADPRTLLRRLYFDMIGLPPSYEDIQAFAQTTAREEAYHRAVDFVLSSPRYGERWAQHWLDLVRYADTHGYEVNTERPNAWPYRDYVIRAFNEDKPYDQFIFEQLAGDTVGQDTATGFLVAAPALLPGQIGKDDASKRLARQDALDEIIVSTGETFLGISIGCARCHDHKFDPISAEDYYAFQAFFAGVEYGDRPINDATAEQQRGTELTNISHRLNAIENELNLLEPLASSDNSKPTPHRSPVNPLRNVERFPAIEARYIRFSVFETKDNNRHEPCLDELEIFRKDSASLNIARSNLDVKTSSSGNYSETGIHQLKHINEGLYGNDHSWISNQKGGGWVQFDLPKNERIDRIIWSRDRTGKFDDRLPTKYQIEVAIQPGHWSSIAGSWDRIPYGDSIDTLNLTTNQVDLKIRSTLLNEQKSLTSKKESLKQGPMIYGGIFRKPDTTFVLNRGDPEQRGEKIHASMASSLGEIKLDELAKDTERRAALALWISRPDNPLTARVMVNRIWQFHFGRGLVDTPSDFGYNGASPTHPQLLDWLAAEFIDSGWSVKHIHRLILRSRTFRQSALVHEIGLAKDSDARLLWRFPGRRLEGEAIRDSILQTSGMLNLDMGGPGFNFFKKRGGLDGYPPVMQFGALGMRRMIYGHKVRMERVPVFGAFDCPDAGQPMARRNQSTTAIQALNLFNSSFVLTQSNQLADRIRSHYSPNATSEEHAIKAFQWTLGRHPSQSELEGALVLVENEGLTALCRVLFNCSEFIFIP